RDHLECDSGAHQRLRLLAATPEHERIAPLQADHGAAGARAFDHQPLDLVLWQLWGSRLLADVDQLGVRARASADRGIRRSYSTVSAPARSSAARRVINPGSPGPAPTRYTTPGRGAV